MRETRYKIKKRMGRVLYSGHVMVQENDKEVVGYWSATKQKFVADVLNLRLRELFPTAQECSEAAPAMEKMHKVRMRVAKVTIEIEA